MREVKFRVFSGGKMHYDPIVYRGKPMCWNNEETDIVDWFTSDQIAYCGEPALMQYTGLKDKNGKEIYEGDIVQVCGIANSFNYKIIFEHGAFYCYHTQLKDFDGSRLKWGGIWRFDELGMSVEVIGNIYENPELF